MTLRCGRIKYTNDLPIYAAFDAGAIGYPGVLHADVPARLNAMLLRGELDMSPVSAFAWAAKAERLVLLPDLCIGARDEVVSVVLVSEKPPARLDGARVYVSEESASGRYLLRILLERRYGARPSYADERDPFARASAGDPTLLIGDAAIDAIERFPAEIVYDLGRLWHEWSGHQTVFAVWAARRDAYDSDPAPFHACMHALTDAYTWSRSHSVEVVGLAQRTIPRPAGFYESYYGKLNFMFHAAARNGLAAYCRELVKIGAIAELPAPMREAASVLAG
ncbi:MAG: menaquinone biosynthesis protein [Candidatus Eremiobacteraeota bacterium]|nr:menaquinone biosynthesis protein [Candidatus Eremiobacteraeota bacterium]MBV8497692.1 menaquinone biosynthesis protein [Candidatus Eremiobacteraeota bacterium]